MPKFAYQIYMYYFFENKRICFYNKNGDWVDNFELCEIEYNIMANNYPEISNICITPNDGDIHDCYIEIYIVSDELLPNIDIKKYKKQYFQHKYKCITQIKRRIFANMSEMYY
jgi:hypothetical protein